MLGKTMNSFLCAWRGLRATWTEEHNFRKELLATAVVFFCLYYFQFSFIESALCFLAATIVLCAEIINTAIEDICNFVEPEYNEVIGKIKDTSGAFVLVAVLGSLIVALLVFWNHFN